VASVIVAWIVAGLGVAALGLAYTVLGGRRNEIKPVALLAHRLCGYLFLVLVVILFAGMLARLGRAERFAPLAALHAALAFAVAGLLLIKILIARFFKKLVLHFFWIGSVIFLLTLTLIGIVAVKPFLPAADPAPPVASTGLPEKLPDVERKFVSLCGSCHALEQTILGLRAYRSPGDWQRVIERMREKTTDISESDGREIAGYLAGLAD